MKENSIKLVLNTRAKVVEKVLKNPNLGPEDRNYFEGNLEICNVYYKRCKRTGCVGCGFGCYATDDERFRILFQLYPKYYEMVMNYTNNGHTYREAVRKVMRVTGKELPDESGEILFPIETK